MRFTNLMNLSRVVQNPFGRRRLPSIDVGNDPDVPRLFQWEFTFVSH